VRILSGLDGTAPPARPDSTAPSGDWARDWRRRAGANLYHFWGDKIARQLSETLKGHADPTLVNLASIEYFGSVDRKRAEAAGGVLRLSAGTRR
jgi:cytoplasmic iron level regulating protein YaaA (DUF328/UPF0246 family)